MKRIIAGMLAVIVLAGAPAVFAKSEKSDKKPACCAALDSLTLTADQKTKVDALMADCKKGTCSKEARVKMTAGLKEILTADQFTQWQAQCAAKGGKKGCCMAKPAKAADNTK